MVYLVIEVGFLAFIMVVRSDVTLVSKVNVRTDTFRCTDTTLLHFVRHVGPSQW